ncbi:helix-turn-helix domain-containing protein [Boudabousia marimammalium]|uniref:helix-turn-helix domain-containing protein n=1 Tax=Boudabousia marimammalium TaxID=156892 RepID=UPI003CCB9550
MLQTHSLQEDPLLNATQALEYLPVTRTTLHRWAKAGEIPSVMIGKQRFFRRSDIIEAITPKTTKTHTSQGVQTVIEV